MMNQLRQVIGADEPPAQRGSLAIVVSQPLGFGEINFIREMSRTGGCPPLDKFSEIHGLVGILDFHVERSTELDGWDGEGVAVILENPRWWLDGQLIPVPRPMLRQEGLSQYSRRSRCRRRHSQ